MTDAKPGPYDESALGEIDAFKNPERGRIGKMFEAMNKPVETMAEAAFETKVGSAVKKAISGVVDMANDGASWTVREQVIFQEFRVDGHGGVTNFESIHDLDLASVDKTVGRLGTKYTGLGAASGGVAGLGGAAGLAADIPALIALALRACNEYAAYHGFDPTIPVERAFVMHLMAAASSPSDGARRSALAELTELSRTIGDRDSWDELDSLFSAQVVRRIAEMLAVRLAKGKIAQSIPLVGTFVGAGYNAWYLNRVTDTAAAMYRERFLIEKFGPEVARDVKS